MLIGYNLERNGNYGTDVLSQYLFGGWQWGGLSKTKYGKSFFEVEIRNEFPPNKIVGHTAELDF